MSDIRTVLADDEPLALERLEALFSEIPGVEIVGRARNGSEASEAVKQLRPDLLILDVQMPEADGLQVAATLESEDRPEIIFVTAFEQYAAEAFQVEAADYLLKPVRFDRLWQAIERAKRRRYLRSLEKTVGGRETKAVEPDTREDGIWVPTKRGAQFVSIDAIDWIEAQRDYVILHTATRSHIMRISMRALEERLNATKLIRVHRSAFARASNVVEVQRTGKTISALVLRDGAIVAVGPNYSRSVAEQLGLSE